MEKENLQLEKSKLNEILEKYKELIEYYGLKIKAIPRIYANNPRMLENFLELYTEKLNAMEKNSLKPYFARIDFKRDEENKVEQLYIGKVGVMDEDNKIITIDWRAPIASMYYDSNIGKASYVAPEGICKGDLLVKRQFDIENGKLNSYQDVDTVSNDDLLKPYLGANADNRLKNIVSTIQSEQNFIIREPLSKNIIVQGVAGSGKTTVALHRIAYLVYNNRDTILPNQYLVIGPNKFFVNYISGVLPDLDVNNVEQLTFEELCENCINEKINLINEEKNLIDSIINPEKLKYERLKVSMKFKKALDLYIKDFDEKIISNLKIEIKGYEIISNELIKNEYFSIENNEIYDSIQKKLKRTKLMIEKYIENNYDDILTNIEKEFSIKTSNAGQEIIFKEKEKIEFIKKELTKKSSSTLNKYFDNKIPKIKEAYYQFLTNIDKYLDKEELEENYLKAENNALNIKENKFEFEDLSALIYLKTKIIGKEEFKKFRQVAIDEAQDYGEFNFYVLKKLLQNAKFSIFGDLAQSIYQYRGINDWKEVSDTTFKKDCEIKYLLKSYRTTTEIMNSANNITKYININPAQPVIRHGVDVKYIKYKDNNEQIEYIANKIKEYKQKGYKSIAVICKDDKESNFINSGIKEYGFDLKNIVDSDTEYDGKICTITSYLAKGLEFDGVIISDASEGKYNSEKNIDMKLMYVSMTRALHELTVFYNKSIIKPLLTELIK